MHYLGTFRHTLDAKNRLFIPARFREKVGEEFVLFKSMDGCISIYDNDAFDKLVEQVSMDSDTPEGRNRQRNFFDAALTVSQDKQGRFTVPEEFSKFAGLETEVVITGEANRLEIWSKKAYEDRHAANTNLTANDYPKIRY